MKLPFDPKALMQSAKEHGLVWTVTPAKVYSNEYNAVKQRKYRAAKKLPKQMI